MRLISAFASAALIGFSALPSYGVTPPSHLDHHAELQVKNGTSRVQRNISWQVPHSNRAAWRTFLQAHPGSWRAMWDADTKVPSRIFGEGIHVPKISSDARAAEVAAEALILTHLELLAPGAQPGDLQLVTNHFDARTNVRSIGFIQHVGAVEVIGGQVSVRIKNDRIFVIGSEAKPHAEANLAKRTVSKDFARRSAQRWIADDFGSIVSSNEMVGPFVLPIVSENGDLSHHTVVKVVVHATNPLGRWSVYLDAATASPVARKQTLMFGNGTLLYNTPERYPQSTRVDYVSPFAQVTLDGQTINTAADGTLAWTGTAPASGTATVRGSEVRIFNDNGVEASFDFTIEDGGSVTWDGRDEEFIDAQLNAYIATNRVKEYAKVINPNLGWLNQEIAQATVNINNACNAFSDGNTINFFQSDNRCENTGRLPDVVFHEFGHSFHLQSIVRGVGDFDGALSEGGSDYLAATITDDAGMGRGFFRSNRALRHLDESGGEASWPEDIAGIHTTGIIFGGTMWDLRKALIANLGMEAGVTHTDLLWYAAMQRAVDIPSTYPEVLAADDDDGDISNGTPNFCAINEAFAAHGLADPELAGPAISAPTLTNLLVHLPVGSRDIECPGVGVQSAKVIWGIRENGPAAAEVTLAEVADGFEALIPADANYAVLQYRVEVTLENGDVVGYPRNPADPFYEKFLGEATEIFCTDFESEASVEGFTHELLSGEPGDGADDWQWGVPNGTGNSGDPNAAYSGARVYGNDLGGPNFNGQYQPDKQNVLHAPTIDASGFESVRLHYRRWLNVEDGFFDQAAILGNGVEVWSNLDTGNGGDTHHEDSEWRFQDVDLSSTVDNNGNIQVDFLLTTDRGLQMGGWTIDDFCIVGVTPPVVPECGNGQIEEGEACDDGNAEDGDGCEANCTLTPAMAACGDGVVDAGEACDDGNAVDGDGCEANCTMTPEGPDTMCPDGLANCGEGGLVNTLPDEEGCGCDTAGRQSPVGVSLCLLALGLLGLLRRRRR